MKRHIAWGIATVWMLTALAGCGCQHQWEEATCTTPKTCTQCGETEGEALGHTWTDATCTDPSTCTRCGRDHRDGPGDTTSPSGPRKPLPPAPNLAQKPVFAPAASRR